MPTPPPLGRTAVRPAWQSLPEPVRHAVAEQLPAPITSVADQGDGFTSGIAAQLRLADGSAVFVKAVPAAHPLAAVYRHEGHTAARLPLATPAPRLRWSAASAKRSFGVSATTYASARPGSTRSGSPGSGRPPSS